MNLEDLRTNDLGQTYIYFSNHNTINAPDNRVILTFHYFAIKAFYFSCQNLEMLENSSGMVINQGNTCSTAIALWFLTCECYSCIHLG